MYIYKSFEEYLQLNYFDIIKDSLLEYIKSNELNQFIDGFGIKTYDEYSIDSIKVVGTRFTKNKIDSVEFKIIFVSEYSVYDSVYNQDSIFPRIIEMKDCFEFGLHGSLLSGIFGSVTSAVGMTIDILRNKINKKQNVGVNNLHYAFSF